MIDLRASTGWSLQNCLQTLFLLLKGEKVAQTRFESRLKLREELFLEMSLTFFSTSQDNRSLSSSDIVKNFYHSLYRRRQRLKGQRRAKQRNVQFRFFIKLFAGILFNGNATSAGKLMKT